MKISKSYSKNKNLGNYESVRIGVTLEKELKSPSKKTIEKVSKVLYKIGKELVDTELQKEG